MLKPVNLTEHTQLSHVELLPGDKLLLTLKVQIAGGNEVIFSLQLDIVAKPVIPAPEAGYALLRLRPDQSVECTRFAYGPQASRIELVNPDDLLQEVVRRRAVFQWMDSIRRQSQIDGPLSQIRGYALQKITYSGSSYFPQNDPVI